MRKFIGLLLPMLVASAYADPVETLYIKNNGDCIGYVWVNNQYQGFVPAGKARYTVHEGFVTGDSGFQPDGTLKQTYSHAGWESSGDTIHVVISMEDSKGKLYATKIDITGEVEHKGYVWFGEQQSGDEPDSLVWEDSTQIQSERQPVTKKKSSDANAYAATKGSVANVIGSWIKNRPHTQDIVTFYANGTYKFATIGFLSSDDDYEESGNWTRNGDVIMGSNGWRFAVSSQSLNMYRGDSRQGTWYKRVQDDSEIFHR